MNKTLKIDALSVSFPARIVRLSWLYLLVALFFLGCNPPTPPQKPNILLMIADDMGYGDLGCYGGVAATPHLDQLASEGVLFTDFYAAASNCSPSRAGLLTGKSPALIGMYSYRPLNHPMHLRDEELTIAEVLQAQGYRTSHIGKWHLGCLPQDLTLQHPQPHDQGFDYSMGTENNAQPSHLNPVNFVRNGTPLPQQKGYSCQILADEFVQWADRATDKNQPFFSYVAFHEPHRKVASPPELVTKFTPDYDVVDAAYLANIENLDLAVGKIIKHLRVTGTLENTIVIFSSDNGSYRKVSNAGLRGRKSYVYEGGIRVPGIVRWPEVGAKGIRITKPTGLIDLMPTICDMLNIKPPSPEQLDGTSLVNLIKGQPFEREKPLYWFFYRTTPEMTMRIGDEVVMGKSLDTVPRTHPFTAMDMTHIRNMEFTAYERYHLGEDLSQTNNLITAANKTDRYYTGLLDKKLQEIQQHGYQWSTLPKAVGERKKKKDWVKE